MVLLARDEAYDLLTWVAAAPLTTRMRHIPTEVPLAPGEDGVPSSSVVNLDNLQVIRAEWLDSRIVRLRSEKMQAVDRAIHFALGLKNCVPQPA